MVDNTPDGPPVPIQALQVGFVYSPLSDRIDDNGNRGIGFLFIVKKRLSKRALQIRPLHLEDLAPGIGIEPLIANNYPPDTMFQRYMTPEEKKEKGRNVRNARLVGMYKGLPTGVESSIAQFVSGIPAEGPGGKNAAQQADLVREQAGVPGVMRDPNYYKQFSGRRRTRQKTRKHTRRLNRFTRDARMRLSV
jgi:hypothetical protein